LGPLEKTWQAGTSTNQGISIPHGAHQVAQKFWSWASGTRVRNSGGAPTARCSAWCWTIIGRDGKVVDKVFGLKTRNEIEEDIEKALAQAQVTQAQN